MCQSIARQYARLPRLAHALAAPASSNVLTARPEPPPPRPIPAAASQRLRWQPRCRSSSSSKCRDASLVLSTHPAYTNRGAEVLGHKTAGGLSTWVWPLTCASLQLHDACFTVATAAAAGTAAKMREYNVRVLMELPRGLLGHRGLFTLPFSRQLSETSARTHARTLAPLLKHTINLLTRAPLPGHGLSKKEKTHSTREVL